MTSLRAGAASDVGRVRTVNQDRYLVDEGLWVVADGMGGHAAGDVAARVAVDTLHDSYRAGSGGDALVDAIRRANQAVWERARADSALRGMGTTLTAVAVATIEGTDEADGADQRLVVANVGDSRAYLFESGELSQLTADHSLVEEMVRAGELTPNEAVGHPQRHIVTRALGIDPDIEVDTWIITPHPGDRFVVCSDGLSNEVADGDIGRVLREEPDAQSAADRLVEMAKANGGTDNITVIVLDVTDDAGGSSGSFESSGLPAISTRPPPTDEPPASALARASRTTVSTYRRPHRITFRVVLFLLALLLLVGGAAAFMVWYARASYYVGLEGNQLVIFQGRPGGVLWFHPTVASRPAVTTAEVPRRFVPQLTQGMVEPSRAAAEAYVGNLVNEYQAENPTPTTTTAVPAAAATTTTVHP